MLSQKTFPGERHLGKTAQYVLLEIHNTRFNVKGYAKAYK